MNPVDMDAVTKKVMEVNQFLMQLLFMPWEEKRQEMQRHSALLLDELVSTMAFAWMSECLEREGALELARPLVQFHLDLFHGCRLYGIDPMFAEAAWRSRFEELRAAIGEGP